MPGATFLNHRGSKTLVRSVEAANLLADWGYADIFLTRKVRTTMFKWPGGLMVGRGLAERSR